VGGKGSPKTMRKSGKNSKKKKTKVFGSEVTMVFGDRGEFPLPGEEKIQRWVGGSPMTCPRPNLR